MRIITLSRKGLYLSIIVLSLVLLGVSIRTMDLALPSIAKHPGTYYLVHTQEKVLALTFDDGPDPLYTGYILDVLKEKNVKATFFVLGMNAQGNPELLKRISEEGHEIANHGYSHSYTPSKFVRELTRTDELLYELLQKRTTYYRPPGGIISESVLAGVKEQGHTLTLWSIDSKDWQNPGPPRIIQNVVKNSFPGGIILLHDGGERREQTIQALGPIIDRLREQGYRFGTVSELRNFESVKPVQKSKLK
ncbi:polysaccharide deacetylase family protein [Desulfitobacterium sp. THU1]|uniref:polysaccharide deacetylase family protein n=1 Tax=Desulfitobacterium sp. THU1 TaxID=3138072 RepID=UPI00311D9C73